MQTITISTVFCLCLRQTSTQWAPSVYPTRIVLSAERHMKQQLSNRRMPISVRKGKDDDKSKQTFSLSIFGVWVPTNCILNRIMQSFRSKPGEPSEIKLFLISQTFQQAVLRKPQKKMSYSFGSLLVLSPEEKGVNTLT